MRRSAATSAPLIVLVGILTGLFGTAFSITEESPQELAHDTAADFVATSPANEASRIMNVQGVAATSVEVSVPLVRTLPEHDEDENGTALGHAARRCRDSTVSWLQKPRLHDQWQLRPGRADVPLPRPP